MPHVVQQGGQPHRQPVFHRHGAELASLLERGERALGQVIGAECVLESGVGRTGVNEEGMSDLSHVAEPLDGRGVQGEQRRPVEPDVVPQWISNDLDVGVRRLSPFGTASAPATPTLSHNVGPAAATASAAMAADLPRKILLRAPLLQDTTKTWYLRGDVGYVHHKRPEADFSAGALSGSLVREGFGDTAVVGVGIGYRFSPMLRADLTLDHRFNTRFKGEEAAWPLSASRAPLLVTTVGFLDTDPVGMLSSAETPLPDLRRIVLLPGSRQPGHPAPLCRSASAHSGLMPRIGAASRWCSGIYMPRRVIRYA